MVKDTTKCCISQYNILLSCIISHVEVMPVAYLRIRDLREDKDLKQSDIAQYLNCTQAAYSLYELGKRDIPTEVLCRLADFHNTSTDYLLGRTDNPKPYKSAKK